MLAYLAIAAITYASCSNPLQHTSSPGRSTAKSSIKVSLAGTTVAPVASKLAAKHGRAVKSGEPSKSIIADKTVNSVTVFAYDAATGAAVGSGSLAKGTDFWSGSIDVSETGSVLFQAYVYTADPKLVYVGEFTQELSGSGDSVTIPVWAVTLMGGSIQLQPSQSPDPTSPKYFSSESTGLSSPQGMTTDGLNIYIADKGNYTIQKIVISSGVTTTFAGVSGSHGTSDTNSDFPMGSFWAPQAITTDGSNLYIADWAADTIRLVPVGGGSLETVINDNDHLNSMYGLATDGSYL